MNENYAMRDACNILLVEDSAADVRLIKAQFGVIAPQCQFTVCKDGEEAINFLKVVAADAETVQPDIVILDLNLPKKNGIDVLRFIKNHEKLKQIPVIMFSTSHTLDDVQNAYEEFANSYIVKPFDFDQFNNAINRIYEYWFNTARIPSTE